MAVLTRVTDFVPNTLIKSQELDDELNQLVNLLSGVSTNKDTLLKYNHATDPVLRVDQLGAGLVQQWLQNGVVRASLSGLGKLLLPAGIGATPSTDQISNFGTYFSDPADHATGANTNETDFSSKTVSANVLAADGDFMLLVAEILYANNANNKRYRLYFGGSVIYDTTAAAFGNGGNQTQFLLALLYRKSSTSLFTATMSLIGNALLGVGINTGGTAPTFSNSNILKSTGQNGTASAGDITQRIFLVLKGSI